MPWYNGMTPLSNKNLPVKVREKAVEIAYAILKEFGDESLATATGVKRVKEWAQKGNVEGSVTDDGDDEGV